MSHQTISTPEAPKAIGPYSQALVSGGFLFSAGQIGLDPKTGALVSGGVKGEARQVFENLRAVLQAIDLGFLDVVKATVYLTSTDDFPALNEVYSEFMGDAKPARSCVAVAALPKGAQVEIDVIARLPA